MRLLRADQARHIDALATQTHLTITDLIENAGRAACHIVRRHYPPSRVHILCGIGNNGADGLVVARHLRMNGFDARVFLWRERPLKPFWDGGVYDLGADFTIHHKADFIIDALFGSGLSRALPDDIAQLARFLRECGKRIIALDVPSGVESDNGVIFNDAFHAERSIAFFRPHPCHFLRPARLLCGKIDIADIGLSSDWLCHSEGAKITLNEKPDFKRLLPIFSPSEIHKYHSGFAVICGGALLGASRLAALAASRIGAGLVIINLPEYRLLNEAGLMVEVMDIAQSLKDKRRNVILLGCGNGVNERTRTNVLDALEKAKSVILDADALTCFESNPAQLWHAIQNRKEREVILTPHQGEFARLFPDLTAMPKLEASQKAAQISGAIMVYKGSDSIIAHPQGDVVINANAPSFLAKAGTGDVLAGLIAGLTAQSLSPFQAACAACYIHTELGKRAGIGLVADDLVALIPQVMTDMVKGDE